MNVCKNLKAEIQIKLVKPFLFVFNDYLFIFEAELQKALTSAEEQVENFKVIQLFHMPINICCFVLIERT